MKKIGSFSENQLKEKTHQFNLNFRLLVALEVDEDVTGHRNCIEKKERTERIQRLPDGKFLVEATDWVHY